MAARFRWVKYCFPIYPHILIRTVGYCVPYCSIWDICLIGSINHFLFEDPSVPGVDGPAKGLRARGAGGLPVPGAGRAGRAGGWPGAVDLQLRLRSKSGWMDGWNCNWMESNFFFSAISGGLNEKDFLAIVWPDFRSWDLHGSLWDLKSSMLGMPLGFGLMEDWPAELAEILGICCVIFADVLDLRSTRCIQEFPVKIQSNIVWKTFSCIRYS